MSDTWTAVLPLENLSENRARKVPLEGSADGSVARSPATEPVPAYDVRITDGTIELRSRA